MTTTTTPTATPVAAPETSTQRIREALAVCWRTITDIEIESEPVVQEGLTATHLRMVEGLRELRESLLEAHQATYIINVTKNFVVTRVTTYTVPAPSADDLKDDQSPREWVEANWREMGVEVDLDDTWVETGDYEGDDGVVITRTLLPT